MHADSVFAEHMQQKGPEQALSVRVFEARPEWDAVMGGSGTLYGVRG